MYHKSDIEVIATYMRVLYELGVITLNDCFIVCLTLTDQIYHKG